MKERREKMKEINNERELLKVLGEPEKWIREEERKVTMRPEDYQ